MKRQKKRTYYAIRRKSDNLYWEGSLSKSPDKWGQFPHFYTTKFQAARSIKMRNIDPDIVILDVFLLNQISIIVNDDLHELVNKVI